MQKAQMLRSYILFFLAIAFANTSAIAQDKPAEDKNMETIIGTWKVQTILSGTTEVARNPTSGQWIEFRADGKYVNKATSLDSGSYRMNENHSALYLESLVQKNGGAGALRSSIEEWTISLQDNTLTMQQKAGETDKKSHADKMKYVYVRIEKGSKKLNN